MTMNISLSLWAMKVIKVVLRPPDCPLVNGNSIFLYNGLFIKLRIADHFVYENFDVALQYNTVELYSLEGYQNDCTVISSKLMVFSFS